MSLHRLAPALMALALAALAPQAGVADSLFDVYGLGRDIIPVAGLTRPLAGAVAASDDPLVASIASPCVSVHARYLTIIGGFAHSSVSSENVGLEKKTTVGSIFPSLGVVVPLGRIHLLTGIYVEKQGAITLAEADTLPPVKTGGSSVLYDATYRRETSIHTVPLYLSTALGRRLTVSTGVLLSFFNLREENRMDFREDGFVDTDDVADAYAFGENFAAAFLLDLDRVLVGGILRTGADLEGSLDRRNGPAGTWSTEDITISSKPAMRLGVQGRPADWISVEVDYDRNPWSRLKINGRVLTDKMVERWAVGVQYRGDFPWKASRYPLSLGYYRQPLDWEDAGVAGIRTGRITEQAYSLGILLPVGQDRAAVTLGLEAGKRTAASDADIGETFYGLSLSFSATEPWRREIKR